MYIIIIKKTSNIFIWCSIVLSLNLLVYSLYKKLRKYLKIVEKSYFYLNFVSSEQARKL